MPGFYGPKLQGVRRSSRVEAIYLSYPGQSQLIFTVAAETGITEDNPEQQGLLYLEPVLALKKAEGKTGYQHLFT